jgi:tetratricopeptide (TPR) repeat protein
VSSELLREQANAAIASFHAGNFETCLDQARALQPHPALAAEMHHLAGAALHQLGRSGESVPELKAALAIEGDNASYYNTFGVVLRKLGEIERAIRSYERVAAINPDFGDVYYNWGNALNELKRTDEAVTRFRRCLQLKPDHWSAHHNLANALRDLKEISEALDHYARSAELQHHNPDMHCNWGLAWQLQERWDKAIDCFQTAISQKSDHAPSHINLGSALAVQERFEEACRVLRRGVELDDSCNDAKFNLGLTLLTIGEFEEGWQFYETRLRLPDKVRPPIDTPMWDGDLSIEEPLLVWCEQGFGDNIQFARYLPILMEAGLKVTYSTRSSLIPLFQDCLAPHCPVLVEHKPSELRDFRHHIALLSLPRLFATRQDTVPMMAGYLKPPSFIPAHLKVRRRPFALHIGLVWASGIDNKAMYADKSMPLEPLFHLFDSWREERLVVLHSLQVGADADQLTPYLDQRGVVDHSKDLKDFRDTACLIAQLDLVITVDTAVAHVAGGLNKPVWTMLQHNADFRWLRGREDSPWYPSMSLVRQRKLGDWDSVIDQMRDRLTRLLG